MINIEIYMNFKKKHWTNTFNSANISFVRGISAVGSAPHWQCGGHGFKSRMLHLSKNLGNSTVPGFFLLSDNIIEM